MRIAEICPTCATYQDATCILYNGVYLSNIVANPGDALDVVLGNINNNLVPLTGTGVPDVLSGSPQSPAPYVGKLYVDDITSLVYYAKSAGTSADYARVLTAPLLGVPEYSNNLSAVFAGAEIGSIYRTGDFLKIVH
jgi:hypothetical protein|tara:strand:+ start:5359 stop:5769 length:411 start_codon:yes stop_codon:yes gene_type:complete